ncbi:GtrA family protein [Pseudohongiella sp. SYSU M77423]|uniref:GtrA family protein n=1 Tax=unclassified Pseudohongiella TaxID=2629611 RepID=UPI001F01087B|nr:MULTISPECIES: GtrA family protein [unclassified Pseudohongiella]MDH7944022.1 GtrA family protein [Pseudohongiella sp. SYSU M77423]
MIRQFASRQFLIFLATGGTAALVNFVSRIIYDQWLAFSTSVLLAYMTGMVTAYVLARAFVFKTSVQPLYRSIAFFVLVNVLAIVQTWAISLLMLYQVLPALQIDLLAPELAHATGIVVPVFTSYLGHKYWSFRSG